MSNVVRAGTVVVGQEYRFQFQEGISIGYLRGYDGEAVMVVEATSMEGCYNVKFDNEDMLYLVGKDQLLPL